MRTLPFYLALFLSFYAVPLAASGNDSAPRRSKTDEAVLAKTGTNVKGESGDFESYLNEKSGEEKESNSVDLVDLGDDAKIAAGGDDSSVGLKMGFE